MPRSIQGVTSIRFDDNTAGEEASANTRHKKTTCARDKRPTAHHLPSDRYRRTSARGFPPPMPSLSPSAGGSGSSEALAPSSTMGIISTSRAEPRGTKPDGKHTSATSIGHKPEKRSSALPTPCQNPQEGPSDDGPCTERHTSCQPSTFGLAPNKHIRQLSTMLAGRSTAPIFLQPSPSTPPLPPLQ